MIGTWIVATEIDPARLPFDIDLVGQGNRHDQRLNLMKTVVPTAKDPQRQINFRGRKDLHSLHTILILNRKFVIPTEVEESLAIRSGSQLDRKISKDASAPLGMTVSGCLVRSSLSAGRLF